MQWPLVGREAALEQGLELVESNTGIAVLGAAGVGKSRLLHELTDRADRTGRAVVNTGASASTRTIPFGPFVELLPGGPTPDLLAMLGAARATLESRAGPRGVLLAVDDAHHLDEASLAFLTSVVSSGLATVAVTVRTGEDMASDLVDLWTNGVIERVDLAPLGRESTRLLVEETIGVAADDLHDELWRLSQGNPLVLHEVLEGAMEQSVRRTADGPWELSGSLSGSDRLADLVLSRLRSLPDEQRQAIEIVALGSPLPLPLAAEIIGDSLGALEEKGLVEVRESLGASVATPSHPLYGEITKEHTGEVRSRSTYRILASWALALDVDIDPLRVALWQRDSGELISEDIAIAGASAALVRHAPALTEDILEALNRNDDRVAVLLGRSLSYRHRYEEAEDLLAGRRHPADPVLATEIASIRGQNLAFGLQEIDMARDVLQQTVDQLEAPDLRARLLNERAMFSAIRGDFSDVVAVSTAVLGDPNTSELSRTAAYVSLTIALAMTADCDGMDELIETAFATAGRAEEALPFARDQIDIMYVMSLINAGRFDEAIRRSRDAVDDESRPPATRTTLLGCLILALLEAGRLEEGRDLALRTLPMYEMADPFGLKQQTLGLLALARGQLGDNNAGESLTDVGPAVVSPRVATWVARGRAWSEAASGRFKEAVDIALEGGRFAVGGQHLAWGAFALHDAVRFGRPELVLDVLCSVDASKGANYVAALQDHARGLVERDLELVADVARRFWMMGSTALAAEAWAWLTRAHEEAANPVESARFCARSKAAQAWGDATVAPALLNRPDSVTDREFETASMAASGSTSSQIAEELFLSVRTVDNHLRSVYRKLAVAGRDELGTYFLVDAVLYVRDSL